MTGQNPGKPGRSEDRAPLGLSIRLFIYLVVGHFFAGFLWLLFEVGANGQ